MTFTRYAIYYAPPASAEWSKFATHWLGWDMEAGQSVQHPAVDGIDVLSVTEVPRKYGLHATMKPPFRLHPARSFAAMQSAGEALAKAMAPVELGRLEVTQLGRFLALRPVGDTERLNALASACVRELDAFRAPATDAELAKRRGAGLSPEQDANLVQWGYPYVLDSFRFHITLSGRLDKPTLGAVRDVLRSRLDPLLPAPFRIDDLALVGEAEDGRFHLIQRYALSG